MDLGILIVLTLTLVAVTWYAWEARKMANITRRQARAALLGDLLWKFRGDANVQAAFYHIEYDEFEYGPEFHGSEWEPKIDRLFYLLDLVGSLVVAGDISLDDVRPLAYGARRVLSNPSVVAYIDFLAGFYERHGWNIKPFAGALGLVDMLERRAVDTSVGRRRFISRLLRRGNDG